MNAKVTISAVLTEHKHRAVSKRHMTGSILVKCPWYKDDKILDLTCPLKIAVGIRGALTHTSLH